MSILFFFFCYCVTKEVKERVPITLKRLFNDGSAWFLLITFFFVFFLVTKGGRWKTKRESIESVAVHRNMGNLSVRTTTTVTTTKQKNSDLRFSTYSLRVLQRKKKKNKQTHIKKKKNSTLIRKKKRKKDEGTRMSPEKTRDYKAGREKEETWGKKRSRENRKTNTRKIKMK